MRDRELAFLSIRFRRRGGGEVTEAASRSSAATAPEYQRVAPTVAEHGGGQKRDARDGAGAPAVNAPGAQMLNVIGGVITGRVCGRENTQDAQGEL